MFLVIHHNDPDGWMSALVVKKYLELHNKDPEIKFGYYSHETPENCIERIKFSAQNASEIYVVDCSPSAFIEEFKDKVIHIDHHASVLDDKPEWFDKVKKQFSALTVDGYLGSDGEQAKQISACELCYISLFKSKDVPLAVRTIGRCDVWDHDENNDTLALSTYINYRERTQNEFPFLDKWFDDLFIRDNCIKAIKQGHKWNEFKEHYYSIHGKRSIYEVIIKGYRLAVLNGDVKSEYFIPYTSNSEIKGMLSYSHNAGISRLSVYSRSEDFSAIELLIYLKYELAKIVKVTDFGGHVNACGMSFEDKSGKGLARLIEVINKDIVDLGI